MQFKYPELLYALFLLVIPIIVHLFQLNRYKKVPFTNVKFLKKIERQNRKSSRLKKWLVLATRLLLFTCLILAFSQPYFSDFSEKQNFKTSIYLDNSFSMQAEGNTGELLKSTAQSIIENYSNQDKTISLKTNSNYFTNIGYEELKNELISINYYPEKTDFNNTILFLDDKNDNKNSLNNIVLISDFQDNNHIDKLDILNTNSKIKLVKVSPNSYTNIYIDSIYIKSKNIEELVLNVIVKSNEETSSSVPIALFEDQKLIGKATSKFEDNSISEISFSIKNTNSFNGKISIDDENLSFDNTFYFTISKSEKIDVLSIGKNSDFLTQIYSKNEFNFSSKNLLDLNYNSIQNHQLVVLNELENIPVELQNILVDYSKNGGSLVFIPAENISINDYNELLYKLNLGKINTKSYTKHKITNINYDHPLINDVFEKKVSNFQYPTTEMSFQTNFNTTNSILKFDDNSPFVSSFSNKAGNVYFFSSPLNLKTSNFVESTLVVPVFYNIAKYSLDLGKLYYTISPNSTIDIKTSIKKDDVLTVSNNELEFIPLQNITHNKVNLIFQNNISKSGFYNISNNQNVIKTIAFNYDRAESKLNSVNIDEFISNRENVEIYGSIEEIFEKINNQQKINWLFKWFLGLSVLFLCLEILLLKYFKI